MRVIGKESFGAIVAQEISEDGLVSKDTVLNER